VRVPNSDWIGLYEVNEKPGNKEGGTYKLVYFYGSGYDAVAEATFTVK